MSRSLRLALLLLLLAGIGAGAQERGSPRELYERGREAQSHVQLLRAIELYRAALQANADYLEPMVGLAEAFFALEEYEEALEHVTRARRYDRGNLELPILEGRIRLGLGQLQEARALFDSVLQREPNNLEARFGLAELDISLGHRREASKRYLDTLKMRPQSEKALLSLAVLAESEGDREAATAYLERALEFHSYDPRVHFAAGRFALEMGEARTAEQYLRTSVALDENNAEARRLLAEALLAEGKTQEAIDELQKVLAVEREEPLVWYALGIAYREADNVEQSINSLARGLQIRPDDEIARLALENLAVEELPINDPVRQKYGRYHLERGRLFEGRNLLGRALLEYRRSLRLDPESKPARLAYGQAYLTLGYPEKYGQELRVLRGLGYTDSVISDDLETIESESWDRVSARWGVSQYQLDKRRFDVTVFHLQPESKEVHPQAGDVATEFFSYLIRRYDAIRLPESIAAVQDFQEAFREARGSGSQYFLILSAEESARSFTVRLRQYLTDTGKELARDRVYRTGNDRVLEALDTLARRFAERLPAKGVLLERRFDKGIVDLGTRDGLEVGDELVIVKKGELGLDHDAISFSYDDEDKVGEFRVTAVDENVAEGTITRRDFFDMINPGDELLFPQPAQPVPDVSAAPGERGLLQRLFRLIGL